jgi:uncharacterized membrane protein
MEELFVDVASVVALLIEAAAVVIVAYGSLEAFGRLVWMVVTPGATHGERKALWRRFGMWLLLGLEFELAADIIGSVISPTWQDIGELGAIAVIRTFLNYFLEKDLEHTESEGRERTVSGGAPLGGFLHVSRKEQEKRFRERLDKPEKNWKFSAADLKESEYWDQYQEAYADMIRWTATPAAPWYVVPADHKWFTRVVVAAAIVDGLAGLNLKYPEVSKEQAQEIARARKLLGGAARKHDTSAA